MQSRMKISLLMFEAMYFYFAFLIFSLQIIVCMPISGAIHICIQAFVPAIVNCAYKNKQLHVLFTQTAALQQFYIYLVLTIHSCHTGTDTDSFVLHACMCSKRKEIFHKWPNSSTLLTPPPHPNYQLSQICPFEQKLARFKQTN